jgi:ankyrin repeat protein
MSKISEFLNDIPPIRRFKAEKQLSRMGYRADDVDDFLQCIRKNRPDAVGLFLKAEKIKFDEKNTGDLALLYASEYGFTEIVSLLLGLEVIDINAQNEDGNTALLCASRNGYTEIASLLLKKKKININAQTPGLLDTPLIIAARQGNIELVRLLLEYPNINVNQENKLGISALYEAIRLGYRDIEDLLVTKDADRVSASQNILKREKGIEFTETAFLEAVNHFDQPIVDLFLDGEITPDARDDERNTPLILASRMGWLSLSNGCLTAMRKRKQTKTHAINSRSVLS